MNEQAIALSIGFYSDRGRELIREGRDTGNLPSTGSLPQIPATSRV